MEPDGSIVVRLHFEGATLEPRAISRMLGKSPTTAYPMGDEIGSRHKRTAAVGRWTLESSRGQYSEVSRLVEELFQGATHDLDIWREVASEYGGFLEVAVRAPELNNCLQLTESSLRAIADRKLGLSIDIWDERSSEG